MKKLSILLASLILTGGIFILSTSFRSLPQGPSANGQGTLDLGTEHFQHFSFHANTANDGTVSGSFEVKSADQDLRLHGTITCLKVLADKKTAFMSGMVTNRDGDGFPDDYLVGDYVYFEVKDNGEGANAVSDRFSDVITSGSTQFCGNYNIGMAGIVGGNIQVKP